MEENSGASITSTRCGRHSGSCSTLYTLHTLHSAHSAASVQAHLGEALRGHVPEGQAPVLGPLEAGRRQPGDAEQGAHGVQRVQGRGALGTVYSVQCTVYSVLCTVYCVLCS